MTYKLLSREPDEAMLKGANRASLSTEVLMDDTRFACERATYTGAWDAAPSLPLSDEAMERGARAHDAEDAAQMGEPSPWALPGMPGDDDPSEDEIAEYAEFRARRIAAFRAGVEAMLGGKL